MRSVELILVHHCERHHYCHINCVSKSNVFLTYFIFLGQKYFLNYISDLMRPDTTRSLFSSGDNNSGSVLPLQVCSTSYTYWIWLLLTDWLTVVCSHQSASFLHFLSSLQQQQQPPGPTLLFIPFQVEWTRLSLLIQNLSRKPELYKFAWTEGRYLTITIIYA